MLPLKQATKQLTTHEKVGQFFMPAAFINDSEAQIQQLETLISEHHIGGLCFFHSRASAATNFEGAKKVVVNEKSFETIKRLINRYQKAAKYPLLIAIDAEWGLAMRIENTPQYPYAITLGALQANNELIYEVGKNIANDCKAAGIHWNLSPCVDINNNPNNPVIGYRSFGDNKLVVTAKAKAYIKGTQSEGILTSIKHFPGHGDTATDSHLGLPVIEKSKEELKWNELYPFHQLINEGVDSVMIGHLALPAITGDKKSSSISEAIIKNLLREEMGFKGVVISDALNMHAVSKNYPQKGELEWLAFNAGNDILCFAEHIEHGIETIVEKATHSQIESSFERIWMLKTKAFSTIKSSDNKALQVSLTDPKALNLKIAKESITFVKGNSDTLLKFRNSSFYTLDYRRKGADQTENDILASLKTAITKVEKEENILLLLTPPQIKPTNNFGYLDAELEFINTLLGTKKVVLYLFGNPYSLKLLAYDPAVATIIAYQDFEEFRKVANDHFLGKVTAKGRLSVRIA